MSYVVPVARDFRLVVRQQFAGLVRQRNLVEPHAALNAEPRAPRKLLLKRKEIRVLTGAVTREGQTLVPLQIHFNERGRAKVLLGLAEGRKKADKRAAIAAPDWQRDKARLMRANG